LNEALRGLEPAAVWERFADLLDIPRPSGHEEGAADYLVSFARQRNLPFERDRWNNVVIRKAGSGSNASGEAIALQAHVDMVAEKATGSTHDFLADPVSAVVRDDRVVAPETTLGADNGIGVALMLAVLDSGDMSHPPLECLFTVDEERGLIGASRFPTEWITAKRMLNLDSEREGAFCIGCAGGMDVMLRSDVVREASVPSGACYRLTVEGLKGGHSGMEIALDRACALRLLGRLLDSVPGTGVPLVGELSGGSKRNAIPREAHAVFLPRGVDPDGLTDAVAAAAMEFEREYVDSEDAIAVRLERAEADGPFLDAASSGILIDLLVGLPHGVQKMNHRVGGLVETSVNLAVATLERDFAEIVLSTRSSVESARDALVNRIQAIGRLAGYGSECSDGYPGWRPDPDSALLALCREAYTESAGREPEIEVIHAGLECGLIGSRTGGLDMVSAGPDIHGVHVPGESVSIPSLGRFWAFLRVLLERA
jgi:dipeptidase D